MRTRNVKLNIFLDEYEKYVLIKKSNKLGISKTEFVRKIIYEFDESVLYKSDINKIHNEILEFIESLSKIRNTLDRHYYKHEASNVDAIIYKLESLLKGYNIKALVKRH